MQQDFRKTDKFQDFLDYGKRVEIVFANECLSNAIFATRYQDQMEHWDVKGICSLISDKELKFDVKSQKKNNRSDKKFSSDLTWIEGKNVYGYDGWIKGKSDYIAFERERIWLIVNREQLYKLTIQKLADNGNKKGKGKYLIYTRENTKDVITQIPFTDMEAIEHYKLLKRN
jgi:hypothetical protein